MKTIYLLVAVLALTARLVKSDFDDPLDDLGFINLTTVTNDDLNSCLMTLSLELHEDHVQFFATIISNPVPDCTHHDLQLVSYFRGDSSNSSVVLAPTANPNVSSGSLTLAQIQALNGTSCLYMGHIVSNMSYYGCHFRYNDLFFTVQLYLVPSNGNINTSFYNLFNPIIGSSNVTINGVTVFKRPAWSFPAYFGQISSECGSLSNVITNLNTELVINGVDLKQYLADLSYFADFTAAPMWIRQKNTTNYIYYYVPDPFWNPFNSTLLNYCSKTGRNYSEFLPNAQFCQNGCDVSFALITTLPYILQTNGFVTVPSRNL